MSMLSISMKKNRKERKSPSKKPELIRKKRVTNKRLKIISFLTSICILHPKLLNYRIFSLDLLMQILTVKLSVLLFSKLIILKRISINSMRKKQLIISVWKQRRKFDGMYYRVNMRNLLNVIKPSY